MSRTWGISLGLASMIIIPAQQAAAQSPELPRVTVGAGAGLSNPLHGDFNFVAPSWDVSIRGRASEHLTVEAFVGEWRHTETSDYFDIPIQSPTGVIGRIGRLSATSTRTEWTTGVNILPTFSVGRVTVTGGGGGGYMLLTSRYKQTLTDCTTTASTGCRDHQTSHGSGALTVQVVGGLDVAVTRHVVAFAQTRFVVPINDPGYGHSSVVAGVRLAIR